MTDRNAGSDAIAAKRAGKEARTSLNLTPTEDLILTLLVSRHRLGESLFLLDRRHRKAMRTLADKGLVHHEEGSTAPDADKVFLTEAGLVVGLVPSLTTPMTRPDCGSFYMGPETNDRRIDCTKRNHHGGKHRSTAHQRRQTKKGTVKVVEVEVRWTDAQAGGRNSDMYKNQIAQHDADKQAAIETALAIYRPDATAADYI